MANFNTRAIILRTNANHGIRCSAANERQLIGGINELLSSGSLSTSNLREVISSLPAAFFTENGLDTPAQYSRLLWDAFETSEITLPTQTDVSHITNFNGPVQAQILQTGPNAKAKTKQNSQLNQLYAQMMLREIDKISDAVKHEIKSESEQTEALAIVDKAKVEIENGQGKPGKLRKILSGLGRWTGGRITKAADAAIDVAVKYGMTGSA